jgi:hypothetical protein
MGARNYLVRTHGDSRLRSNSEQVLNIRNEACANVIHPTYWNFRWMSFITFFCVSCIMPWKLLAQ